MGHTEELCRFDPAMAGDDAVVIAHENGICETETRNAVRELADLALGMRTGVPGICLECCDWTFLNRPDRSLPTLLSG